MGRNHTAVVGMVTSSHFNMLGLKSKGSLIGNEFGVNPPRPIIKEALQKPSLILRSESFCLLHRLNFCANDCSGYF